MVREKIVWYCPYCQWVQVSDTTIHHCMDTCPCGKCSVDAETYSFRAVGRPVVLGYLDLDQNVWMPRPIQGIRRSEEYAYKDYTTEK